MLQILVSPGPWLAALCTAAALWLLVPDASPRMSHGQFLAQSGPESPDVMPRKQRLQLSMATGFVVALLTLDWVGVLSLAVGAIFGWALFHMLPRLVTSQSRLRQEELIRQLPQTLDLIAVGLAVGSPLSQVIRHVAAVSDEAIREGLRTVWAQTDVGIPEAEAWRTLAKNPIWHDIAVDLSRSSFYGTTAAEMLKLHASDARRRRRDHLQTKARAAGVRAALPLMCCYLPAFILIGVVPILVETFSGMFS